MASKSPKTAVVAFKVEEELADFLNKLPNKSAFIRKAIAAQMSTSCPLCGGSGQVTRWTHDNYARLLTRIQEPHCDGCGDSMALPKEAGDLSTEQQERLEQYFKGGPLYCDPCYGKAPPCDDCGMHIAEEQAPAHVRQAHAHSHSE
jgi:hypothetical protein